MSTDWLVVLAIVRRSTPSARRHFEICSTYDARVGDRLKVKCRLSCGVSLPPEKALPDDDAHCCSGGHRVAKDHPYGDAAAFCRSRTPPEAARYGDEQ